MARAAIFDELPWWPRPRVRSRAYQSGGFQCHAGGACPESSCRHSAGDHRFAMNAAAHARLGRNIAEAFLPNRVISKTTLQILIALQLSIFVVIWWRSPFAVLPRPDEVVKAFGTLWMNQGLGPELWTSFKANIEALASTAPISLGLAY